MSDSTRYLPFVGRLLIGVVFLMSGLSKIPDYAGITTAISGAGLPFAGLGFAVAVVVEIGLGLLLLVGYRARPVALALAIWCVVTAIFFHRNFADQNMMIHFLKNIMIAGGLLQIVHFGASSVSLDTLSRREMPDRSGGENFARQGVNERAGMASETGETAQTSGLDVEQALHHVQIDLDDLGVRRERLAGGDPWTNSLAAPKAGLSLAAECRVVPASGRVAARPGAAAVGYLRTHAQKTRIEITEFSRSRDSPRMCPPTQKKTPWRRAIF